MRRTRAAGDRVDHVSIDPAGLEPKGFDAGAYEQMAALAREGLVLLKDAPPGRRAVLEDVAALGDFLAKRMPALLEEWRARRAAVRASGEPSGQMSAAACAT